MDRKLTGEYLKAYHQIELLSHNLSFFMNNDACFEMMIKNDALDLL